MKVILGKEAVLFFIEGEVLPELVCKLKYDFILMFSDCDDKLTKVDVEVEHWSLHIVVS
jgi:hypothetical protein